MSLACGVACASDPGTPAVTPMNAPARSSSAPAATTTAERQAATTPPAPTAAAPQSVPAANQYAFKGGYPLKDTVDRSYDDVDLNRAIQAYKFFFPSVAFATGYVALEQAGIKPNHAGAIMAGSPKQIVYTPNSDTPYAMVPLDLSSGPMVVELPAGPLICVVNDLNQRYVMDLGLPGPDAGKGGKHVIIPPGYQGHIPQGYYSATATTNRVILAMRALPEKGDMPLAIARLKAVEVHPLAPVAPSPLEWVDVSDRELDMTPSGSEKGLKYWQALHDLVDGEPPYEAYRMYYGELAELGIEKGKPFAPDTRMQSILAKASDKANDQMRVQAFADRSPTRFAWPDRKWEWAGLRPENGTFDLPTYKDLAAREKWFFQAVLESPVMFRRGPGSGSLYWLGVRDKAGAYLDGKKTYRLAVPLPVPNRLFWSVTVYDPETRSEIRTPQGKAALRSLVELKELGNARSVELYFGPKAPAGQEARFIQTLPNKGWFAYFRVYGPEQAAFDGNWKPGDFEEVR
jgi:hypothetical protein